jgi:hypothetical protein
MKSERKAETRTSIRTRRRAIADWLAVSVAVAMIVGVAAATINWRTASTVATTIAPTNSK